MKMLIRVDICINTKNKLAFIYNNWGYIGVAPINKDNESFFYSGR